MTKENISRPIKFIKISPKDIKAITSIIKDYPSYSDFNPLSMLAWNSEGKNQYSIFNDNLVIKISSYLGDGFEYSVLGKNKIDETIDLLINQYKKLSFVPEAVVNSITQPEKYKISQDRDNYDYIMSLQNLAKVKGGEYKSLRRYIKDFINNYPKFSFREIDTGDSSLKKAIIELTRKWCKDKSFSKDDLTQEITDTTLFLNNTKYFNTVTLGIYVNNKLISYTSNEIIDNEMIMGHYGKALNSYKGNSYFIEHLTAKYFFEKGFTFINHQQDCGIKGLRMTKNTYKPIKFLKKFTIEKKD